MFLLDRRVYRLLLARLFDTMASGLFMMALPWLILKLGYSGSTVAIITLFSTVTSFVMTPYLSGLIDRFSRKNLLVIIQGLQLVTALLLFISAEINHITLLLLIFTQLVFWVSTDMAWDATNALIQENFQKNEYIKITGYQMIVRQSTFLGSAAAGVILLELWSINVFALFAVTVTGLSLSFYFWMPYQRQVTKHTHKTSLWKIVQNTKLILAQNKNYFYLFSFSSFTYAAMTYLVQLVLIYFSAKGYKGDWYALWNTGTALGGLLSGVAITLILRKWLKQQVIVGCLFLMAIFSGFLGMVTYPAVFILVSVILGFLNILNNIARTSFMHEVVAISERGRLDGGLKLVTTLCQGVGYAMVALFSYTNTLSLGFYFIALCLLFFAMASQKIMKEIIPNLSTNAQE